MGSTIIRFYNFVQLKMLVVIKPFFIITKIRVLTCTQF